MPIKQGEFERGDSGIGRFRFSADGKKVQVILDVPRGDTFERKEFIVDRDNCPDNISSARKAEIWKINMSSRGDRVMSFYPATGSFVVTTNGFVSREGEEPTPKTKFNRFVQKGKKVEYSYELFTVLLSVVEGELKGFEIPLFLRYNFAEFVENGKSIAGFSMGGKYTSQLEEYMSVAGILDTKYQPMLWSDNLLPFMQRIALHENRKFVVTVKNGWVVNGSLIPYDEPKESVPWNDEQEIPNPIEDFIENDDNEEIDFEPEFE